MTLLIGIVLAVLLLSGLILRDVRRQRRDPEEHTPSKGKNSPSLQEFLPFEGFEPSGAMRVAGHFRRMIRVGDVNLYSLSSHEIKALRDQFKAMLQRLNEPFQIVVQARRANYQDYVAYCAKTLKDASSAYGNPAFRSYSEALLHYIREESSRPRTDRANLVVVGALPKLGGESEASRLERVEREVNLVAHGFGDMGIAFRLLSAVEQVEALQNWWNRERAVSQRYRDAYDQGVHATVVEGGEPDDETVDAAHG